MKVVVIGGTNFLGPPVVRRLVAQGHEVAVFHRGHTQADLPPGVEHILGDRHQLDEHAAVFRRLRPEVVVDMIAYTERDAVGLVETFRGLAHRSVVISSADVYRAYGRFLGLEPGPIESTPLTEESPLRTALFPYRNQAQGPEDFFHDYDKIRWSGRCWAILTFPARCSGCRWSTDPATPTAASHLTSIGWTISDRQSFSMRRASARWKCPRGYVEDVAAAIALAGDERAAGRVLTSLSRIHRGRSVVGSDRRDRRLDEGEIVDPAWRLHRHCAYQVLHESRHGRTGRIRRELGFVEVKSRRERPWSGRSPGSGPSPPEMPAGLGLLDYDRPRTRRCCAEELRG